MTEIKAGKAGQNRPDMKELKDIIMQEKQRILIVDDSPSNIKILNDILKHDYYINAATSGPETLRVAAGPNKPDLILLDIMMPGMNGYQTCKKLKASKRTRKIPIIFVTAKGGVENESKGFALGCVDYITKPVSPPIVLARVKTHLALRQALETLESQNKKLKAAATLREEVERVTRHDLKNPLTGIYTGVDLVELSGDLVDDQIEGLNVIKCSAHKMLGMINSSLDLFKMEQNIYQAEIVDVDLIDIIYRIEQEFKSLIGQRKTHISICLESGPLQNGQTFLVKGETLLLYSMMANLIKNAIEAVSKNETVSISLSHGKKQGVIRIHNPGTVPQRIQKTFFEKYTTAGKIHGTGLGTYSAKLIAKTLGGKIDMTSSKKEGTSIFIHLPAGG